MGLVLEHRGLHRESVVAPAVEQPGEALHGRHHAAFLRAHRQEDLRRQGVMRVPECSFPPEHLLAIPPQGRAVEAIPLEEAGLLQEYPGRKESAEGMARQPSILRGPIRPIDERDQLVPQHAEEIRRAA